MDQQREYRYNNSLLRVRFCDIVEANTDVIVNSDDYLLPMADGLSAYLWRKEDLKYKMMSKRIIMPNLEMS